MNLNKSYNREDFIIFLNEFLPSFEKDIRSVSFDNLPEAKKARYLGESKELDELAIFEIEHKGVSTKKVGLANDAFKLMKQSATSKALVIFYSEDTDNWRLSLMTMKPEISDTGKVTDTYSNPRRYSFALGPEAKTNTPYKFLVKKGSISNFEELSDRFSVEVVNKEFYQQISLLYIKLLGGERKIGNKKETFSGLLQLPYTSSHSEKAQRFAVRLIGRIIFCWFLKEKKSEKGSSLIPSEILSFDVAQNTSDYYHSLLEPLFFEVLNKHADSRNEKYQDNLFNKIPYLNGGLFSPDYDDHYDYNEGKQAINHNIVKVPDEWLRELFEVLDLYNFTVDENTSVDVDLSIDPEMLGRIFENLLAEINPETGESARKKTGSFYTPREIVEYMVDQSLIEYLKNITEIKKEKLAKIISYDSFEENLLELTKEERKKIVKALSELKTLDQACGSGAFPIGLLQKVVLILQRVDPKAELWFEEKIGGIQDWSIKRSIKERFESESLDYIRKLGVIRDSIFGVDIQPIATEISRLRCFLTLVVEDSVEDEKPNRGIEPLPNLDFKFVTANSLIPLPGANQDSIFDDKEGIERLKELREQYFNASNSERDRVKLEFSEAQKDMLQRMISLGASADLTQALSTWKPFKEDLTQWFDPEWMFGVKAFDVVIGNPPYAQLQKNSGEMGLMYKEHGYKTFARTGDIYALFYERGLELSRQGLGLLCYITSNKWMRAGYGEKLREHFSQKQPLQLLDFGGFKVFESATVDTNILLIQNKPRENDFYACHFKNDYQKGDDLREYFENNKVNMEDISGDTWFIGSPAEVSLKEKIEQFGKPLEEWGVCIYFGIKTGFNEAFIIDQKKRDELIAHDSKSEEIIKPVLRGRDIKRYGYNWNNLYLITTFPSLGINIDHYSAVKDHLLSFGQDKLEQVGQKLPNGTNTRKKTGNQWFETQDQISYYDEFEKEKITWQEIARRPSFCTVEEGTYILGGNYFMTGGDETVVAILNSKLSEWYFKTNFQTIGEGGLRYKPHYLNHFPLKKPDDFIVDSMCKLFYKITALKKMTLNADTSDFEHEIDQLVYKLYRLTDEEIKVIESK